MFFHVQKLINEIVPDEPDPAAANALQEGLGGQFGEMRTMMQYMFQSFNARGKATPYKDLIQGVSVEEISHVELIATTINYLLDGSAMARVRALRRDVDIKACTADQEARTILADQQREIGAILPQLPNERLVYRCRNEEGVRGAAGPAG